ncbi:hypothetical protein DFH08DRAFT_1084636 [Mycena albidolilacea]|uniref:Uncharacterized protein n=1 Tax=Mycena albidolilacea TaxID=1033008 RepID=A0AAD6ZL74_9AGAR|nr:hypothetical protein DFH08DRAFT_1084636 [Mycena albidolilacea]
MLPARHENMVPEARKIRVNKEHDYSPSTTPNKRLGERPGCEFRREAAEGREAVKELPVPEGRNTGQTQIYDAWSGCKDNLASEKDMGGSVGNEGGWRAIWARSRSSGTKGKLEVGGLSRPDTKTTRYKRGSSLGRWVIQLLPCMQNRSIPVFHPLHYPQERRNGHWARDDRDSENGRGKRGLGSGSAGAGLSMLANSTACSLLVEHEERGSGI